LTAIGDRVLVGYQDGSAELVPLEEGSVTGRVALGQTAAGAVSIAAEGPRGTVVLGWATGDVGLWSSASGRRLLSGRLPAAVVHVLAEGDRLHLATELGHHATLSLGPFLADRCALLDEVWQREPTTWDGQRVVRRLPPEDHPCAR
jgi:hypothetical protein